jgi:glutamate-1-semialdehyde aminotransferase
MLDGGVFLAASQFEAAFVSLAHTRADLDEASGIAHKAFALAR